MLLQRIGLNYFLNLRDPLQGGDQRKTQVVGKFLDGLEKGARPSVFEDRSRCGLSLGVCDGRYGRPGDVHRQVLQERVVDDHWKMPILGLVEVAQKSVDDVLNAQTPGRVFWRAEVVQVSALCLHQSTGRGSRL